jgi:hypothetical protein
MGYPTSIIDSASFTAAADALYRGFGLNLLESAGKDRGLRARRGLAHQRHRKVRPDTEFALKLIAMTASRVAPALAGKRRELESFERDLGETTNEIVVVHCDVATNTDRTVRCRTSATWVHGIAPAGATIRGFGNTPGSCVALRDLRSVSTRSPACAP